MKFIATQQFRRLLLAVFAGFASFSFGQTVIMGEPGYLQSNPADCSTFGVSANNFFDDGAAGNYSANFNDTTVLCPDLTQGTKMTLTFAINAGFTFDVDGSDWIYVYDGPSTASPLLGQHNSVTDPTGFAYTASWNNPSGCLTVVFISDGAVQGTGWSANAQCGNQNQPFDPHIEAYVNGQGPNALNPLDTGYVDVCFGDSILFVAKPIFPYSLENTTYGYSQTVNNVDFDWYTSDGGTHPNNDSIWFTPPSRNGFLVDLKITDQFPQIERMLCKVRVSQLPNFAGTGPLEDTVCLGQQTTLIGGVTPTDTVGIDIPPGQFQLGGSFAGLTYLPDGSGQQYQAPIDISGFPAGATIANPQDLNQVCITMEHSYLGDLEIALECPNGTQVTLVNSYSPGFIPGGFNGGGTYLGDPIDDSGGGGPGAGWEYCFSSVFNSWGSFPTEFGGGNTIPAPLFGNGGASMNPNGVYLPENNFSGFAGCPINGQWTIIVQDNLGIDDGYIFEWGLFFDPSFFPGSSSYQNYVVSDAWLNDPTIISGQNDTLIVVQPNIPGNYDYTYTVIDDFGCYYDTTVTLYVLPQPEIFEDTIACNFGMQVSGTVAYGGGVWSSADPSVTFSNANLNNPYISSTDPGVYAVSFTDDACGTVVTANIDFPPYPEVMSDTALCSLTLQATGTVAYSTGGYWSEPTGDISFSPSAAALNPTFTSSGSGVYTITFTDSVCGNTAATNIEFISPPQIFNDTLACNQAFIVSGTVAYNGGIWSSMDTTVHFTDSSILNPDIYVTYPGTYTVTFTDNTCNMSVSAEIEFPPYVYTVLDDTVVCFGTEIVWWTFPNWTVDEFVWSTGETGPSITVSEPGVYTVTGSNVCHSSTATAILSNKLCDIEAPNVISLSSTAGNNLWFVDHEGIKEFNCVIVNRWGNVIYEFNDPSGSWDGRTLKGDLVEEGTYFYTIKSILDNGEPLAKHGLIQVIH